MRSSSWLHVLRRNPRVLLIVLFCIISLTLLSSLRDSDPNPRVPRHTKYVYQQSYSGYNERSVSYNITVVADMDKESKTESGWRSEIRHGVLTRDEHGRYSISWTGEPVPIHSKYNEGGRGMELSELVYFNKRLLSCDDRTGIVYEIDREKNMVIPQNILMDGNGRSSKGFKCEWATVKDDHVYIGGLGKEWTTQTGEVLSRDPQWIKIIDIEGKVLHRSWIHVYEALRAATGTLSPGYLIHEAVRFHPILRRWFFLPRRASTEPYNDVLDEKRGTNLMLSTDEDFEDIQIIRVGPETPTHGFSSFVFLPFREHEIAALKTEEVDGVIASYITVFNLEGVVLLEETKIGDIKYEGIEVV